MKQTGSAVHGKTSEYPVVVAMFVAFLGGCKSIPLKDGYYSCDPGVSGSCPSGMTCRWSSEDGEYRCFAGAPGDAYVPVCGNGAIDPGEQCDGQSLGGQTCQGLGHPGGTLACSGICTYDRSGCDPPVTCGDGDIDPPGEQCDGSDLGGATCQSLDYDTGVLGCLANCTYDTSGCFVTPVCGNGQTETGEQCDDGNSDPGDGCGPTCLFEECGNGYPDPGEACDDGNTTGGDGCSADCLSDETCGNGVQDTAIGEECDDGNSAGCDGCSPTCCIEECGNGTVDCGEVCDDANTSSGDGCSADCVSDETCGNGYLDTAIGEQCDDGNTVNEDGCSANCVPEYCGDNVLQPGLGEECDDGNNSSGDGCSANCLLEGPEVCTNGVDDDGDGVTDCVDSDCWCDPNCPECEPAAAISCGASENGTTVGGPQCISSYDCAMYDDTGPEAYYIFSTSSAASVTVALSAGQDLDLIVLGATGGECDPNGACVDASQSTGGNEIVMFNASASTTYYIVVDGYDQASGSFALDVTCQ